MIVLAVRMLLDSPAPPAFNPTAALVFVFVVAGIAICMPFALLLLKRR